jgi:hypothetical protein
MFGFAQTNSDIKKIKKSDSKITSISYSVDSVEELKTIDWDNLKSLFEINKGDEIILSIVDSSNATIIKRKHKFSKYQARYFFFVGKKLRGKKLSGKHILVITYKNSKGGIEKFIKNINL